MFSAPSTLPTKADATRFLAVVEADIARGLYIDPRAGRVTFAEWSDRWLARPGQRAASTARDRQALASFHPHLGSVLLIGLTPGLVQEAVDLRSKVAAPATVARDFSALRAVLNAAVNADLIARSPARNIALPRVVHPERSGLSPSELAALVKEVPGHYQALVLVGAVLGLRWGEAVGLRVRDVDFMRHTVTIAQTAEELSGHMRIVPEAKTRSSLRTLAVPGFLMDELARHLQQHRQDVIGQYVNPDALIFVGPRGGTLRRRFGERILRPAGKRAGISTSLTFHSLRQALRGDRDGGRRRAVQRDPGEGRSKHGAHDDGGVLASDDSC
ncbi:MAG: tyrosine-type recombinase/integrase [Acidimicrobiales bacterium]